MSVGEGRSGDVTWRLRPPSLTVTMLPRFGSQSRGGFEPGAVFGEHLVAAPRHGERQLPVECGDDRMRVGVRLEYGELEPAHRLLVSLTHGRAWRGAGLGARAVALDRATSPAGPDAELISDLVRIHARKKAANKELTHLVAATGTGY